MVETVGNVRHRNNRLEFSYLVFDFSLQVMIIVIFWVQSFRDWYLQTDISQQTKISQILTKIPWIYNADFD